MKTLSILFCFFLSFSAFSQDVRFGLNLSPGISWLNSSDENDAKSNGSNLNFAFGIKGEYQFSDRYALTGGLGLGFSQGGTVQYLKPERVILDSEIENPEVATYLANNDNIFPADTEAKYLITYVEVPISLKLRTSEIGNFIYYAELPIIQFNINTAAEGEITLPTGSETLSTEGENITKDVTFLDIQWGVGAGVEYNISDDTYATLGLKFNAGTIDINEVAETRVSNRRINLVVGILF